MFKTGKILFLAKDLPPPWNMDTRVHIPLWTPGGQNYIGGAYSIIEHGHARSKFYRKNGPGAQPQRAHNRVICLCRMITMLLIWNLD